MFRPKKRLGQHFLTDKNIAAKITGFIKASDYDNLIEVGPGKGILTQFLLKENKIKLFPIEIDHESVMYLIDRWPELKEVMKEADFLNVNLGFEYGEKFGIIGNFPYNISSQIFFRILEYKNNCREVVCMIQKEVADRILSPPGNKTYGILSVLLQTWFNIDYLMKVNPGSFFPPPKVISSVIRLERNGRNELPVNETFFYRVVKTAFNQRRKMLRNSLKSILPEHIPAGLSLEKRPEHLSVEEFITLAQGIADCKSV
jgi:16S rRNA (adenine1518-N6/adenine1519-N6)-dimethyltransferase